MRELRIGPANPGRKLRRSLEDDIEVLVLDEGVTQVHEGAFEHLENLREVRFPSTLTTIETEAFARCGIRSLKLPKTIQKVHGRAFADCGDLTDLTLEGDAWNNPVDGCCFAGCSGLRSVTCDATAALGSLAGAGPLQIDLRLSAEWSPAGLRHELDFGTDIPANVVVRSLVVPAAVRSLGGEVLRRYRAEGLALDLSETDRFREVGGCLLADGGRTLVAARDGCARLVIPEGVVRIAEDALACGGLREVVFPSTLVQIGTKAFAGSGLGSVVLPERLEVLAPGTFADCAQLEDVVLPSGLRTVGECAFMNCHRLKRIVLPACVRALGCHAFGGCRDLAEVMLGAGLEQIGAQAFAGCRALASLTLPASLSELGERAFRGCTGLKSIAVADGNARFAVRGPNLYERLPDGTIRLACSWDPDTRTVLPPEVEDVAPGAFDLCPNLVDIAFGDGVEPPFRNVDGLLLSPDGRTVLGSLPGYSADTLPEGVEEIGPYAFAGRRGLRRMILPDSVAAIGSGAFAGCENLGTVRLSAGLWWWGEGVFAGCTGLKEVVVPRRRAGEAWRDEPRLFRGGRPEKVRLEPGARLAAFGLDRDPDCTGLVLDVPASMPAAEVVRELDCAHVVAVAVPADHPTLRARNGLLYDRSGMFLLRCPAGACAVTVPAGTTGIAAGAFEGTWHDDGPGQERTVTFLGDCPTVYESDDGTWDDILDARRRVPAEDEDDSWGRLRLQVHASACAWPENGLWRGRAFTRIDARRSEA